MSTNTAIKRDGVKRYAIQFSAYCFGFFLNVGSYVAVCGLQSSINIEKSVGTITLGIAYTVSFLTGLLITPTFIRRFGCKYALLAGEIAHLLFVAANFYPVPYVMITTGVIVGIGEGIIWTALPMFSTYFGIQHAKYGTKSESVYTRKCTGILLGCYFLGQCVGSAMVYALLHGGKTESLALEMANFNISRDNHTSTLNVSDTEFLNNPNLLSWDRNITKSRAANSTSHDDPFEYCGARDCQNPEVTKARIDNYVPAEKKFLYILLSVFCVISLIGILLHVFILPPTRPHEFYQTGSDEKLNEDKERDARKREKNTVGMISTLVATVRHATSPNQILLVPILLYGGLFYGFYLSELSRAYTSCLLGVEKVGLTLMVFSTTCSLSSFLCPAFINCLGRNKAIVGYLVLDLSNYTFCQLWRPQEDTLNLVFLIYIVFGLTESGWKNCCWSFQVDFFPDNPDIALTMWNLFYTIGIALSFVWSPLLCVGTKIYIQSVLLIIGVAGYGLVEFLNRRKLRESYDNNSCASSKLKEIEESRSLVA